VLATATSKLQDLAAISGLAKGLPVARGPLLWQKQAKTLTRDGARGTVPTKQTGTVTADNINNDSEYSVPIIVGTSPKAYQFNVDPDTGSSDLWLLGPKCKPLVNIAQAPKRNYYIPPTGAKSVGTWNITYGDGSYASGTAYRDNVNIGGIIVENQVVEQANKAAPTFTSSPGDGLIVSLA